MLKFFRQIRQKLIEQENVRKYVWYALGEILLVVIGILLALQVNNWNEQRKAEESLKIVLKEVQEDLYNDLVEISLALDWHIEKDSISTRMIENRYDIKDFENPENEYLFNTALSYYDIIISDRSFQLLSDFKDRVPAEYRGIIKRLNNLYIEDQAYLNRVQDMIIVFTMDYKNNVFNTHEWATPSPDWPSEEWIRYFSEDTYHKRKLFRYRSDIRGLIGYAKRMKDKAVTNYMIIRSLLNDDSELPKFVKDYGMKERPSSLNYAGIYEYSNEDGAVDQVQINELYDVFVLQYINDRAMFYFSEILLAETAPDMLQFALDSRVKIEVIRDSTGAIEKLKTTSPDNDDQEYYPLEQ
ncbi:MAG: hypothetical protein JJ895_07035 [Balneolaceae bacterium]|nr:hypothetical protein [Balneolaceae bacterium]